MHDATPNPHILEVQSGSILKENGNSKASLLHSRCPGLLITLFLSTLSTNRYQYFRALRVQDLRLLQNSVRYQSCPILCTQ